jgi:hypothetical protein
MPAPTVSASLDKTAYQPDETMTLTVTYSDPDTEAVTVTVVVTDSQGNTSDPATVTAVVDPSVLTVTDSSGRVWTKVSDNGSVAVYTAAA